MTSPDPDPAFAFVASDALPHGAVAAATLIMMRPASTADEICMLRRSATMAFGAGAWAFPGGRVDPDDRHLAERLAAPLALDADDAAARIAAIRETIEETGVAPGLSLTTDAVNAWRRALREGTPMSTLIDRDNQYPDLKALIPYARWCPNFNEARTFDTRFYLWRASGELRLADVDPREHDAHEWIGAGDAIKQAGEGRRFHLFPTARTLERLASTPIFGLASGDARKQQPIPLIVPAVRCHDGVRMLEIPSNAGYPVTSHRLSEQRRS